MLNEQSVLVNFKRIEADQAKRIVDFLAGTTYAIGGDVQKVGEGIFLCTPANVDVEGVLETANEEKTNF